MSFLKYNDIAEMSRLHRSASSLMTRPTRCIHVTGPWTFGSPSVLMMFHRTAGALDQEQEDMRQCMPYYYQITAYHGSGAEHVMEGEIHYQRGEMKEAEVSCHLALRAAEEKEQYSILITAAFLGARISLAQGNPEEAERKLHDQRRLLTAKQQYPLIHALDMCQAWAAAVMGRWEAVPAWIGEDHASDRVKAPCVPMLYCIQQHVRLLKGDFSRVIADSLPYIGRSRGGNNLLCVITLMIQQAGAEAMTDNTRQAEEILLQALEMAVPDRIYMPFAEYEMQLDSVLKSIMEKKIYEKEIRKILSLNRTYQQNLKQETGDQPEFLLQLTEQERLIAQMAARLWTNEKIGAELNLSENTVKTHLRHIFDKAGIPGSSRNKKHLLAEMMPDQSR